MWPLLTVEAVANGDLWSTNEGGPSLVGSLGFSCECKSFSSWLGCSGQQNKKYFFLTVYYFNLCVQSTREGGMDLPSQHKSHPAGSLSSSLPGGPPCWVISLAFELIGLSQYRQCVDITDRWALVCFISCFFLSMKC